MATINVSLSETLKQFVDQQVVTGCYGSGSAYVRELIRRDRDRVRVRELVLQGAASSRGPAADGKYFDALRARSRDGKRIR